VTFLYGAEGGMIKNSDRNGVKGISDMVLNKNVWNVIERILYQ